MSQRVVVLIHLDPDDQDAAFFHQAIEGDAVLKEQVELVFARREILPEVASQIEVLVCGGLPQGVVATAKRLRWISFWSAGLDGKVTPGLLERHLLITSASGVHGPNIAEHVLGMMIYFTRRFDFYVRAQMVHRWDRDPPGKMPGELFGQTLGIVGFGRIGEALAERARAFGMRVIALKRDTSVRYNPAVWPDRLLGPEGLDTLLSESDHVCLALPYTTQTHHFLDAPQLAIMRPTAYLYNIARGKIVNEQALVEALQKKQIAGAGLDVFEEEPLPAHSPLWSLENVLLTPHVSGVTPRYFERFAPLFAENLKRYLQGLPLHNLYDPHRGY